MQKYKPLILRILGVVGLVLIIAVVILEYRETHNLDRLLHMLPKVLITCAAIVTMLVGTVYKKIPKKDEPQMRAEFAKMTDGIFKPEDKRAKDRFYRGFRAGYSANLDTADYHYRAALKQAQSAKAQAFITAYLGRNALQRKDFLKAETLLQEATVKDPACVTARCQLMELYTQRGEFEKARDAVETGLLYCPNNVLLLSRTGNCAMETKDYETALRDFQQARRLAPDSDVCAANLALAYAALGREAEALEELAAANLLHYAHYDTACQKVRMLLDAYERRRVHFTGKYVLEWENGEPIEDCTPEELYGALQAVWNGDTDFVVLTPPAPIRRVLFMQTAWYDESNAVVQISVGDNGIGTLHEKICPIKEVNQMFMQFLTERTAPSMYGFTELH